MALGNTSETYGWPARLLHWSVAILLVAIVFLGLKFGEMPNGPEKSDLRALHKSLALTTLILMTIRLYWRLTNPRPADPIGIPGWQKAAALWTHWLLYAAVFFQLSMGILMSGHRTISFFGVLKIPPFLEENEEQHEFFEALHEFGWTIIAGLVALHVLAALYNHFKQKNGVLLRMLKS